MSEATRVRRVLLVGFMGSGKTRVGQALARRLGWVFRDFDQEIGSRLGLPIPEIFRQHGEAGFREMEHRVGAELLREVEVVLACGGGWPAALGRMEELAPDTFSVWLRVSAEEAVRRIRQEGPTRPLLAVDDPLARARELLARREAWYRMAEVALETEATEPEDLARRIEDLVNRRGRGGTPFLSPRA
jgi:shikimate kinase